MSTMRIGASLLLLDGTCLQSYGWTLRRPLGDLQLAVRWLEAYEVDEIAICRPVRADDSASRLRGDIEALRRLRSTTPLSFGGGLRGDAALDLLLDAPLERVIMSSAFVRRDEATLAAAVHRMGRQAVMALLPVRLGPQGIEVYCCADARFRAMRPADRAVLDTYANEVVLHDVAAEGTPDGFDLRLLAASGLDPTRVVISGGIGRAIVARARSLGIAAVHVENRVLHTEFSIREFARG